MNLEHYPTEQLREHTSSDRARERSRDACLRGIGAWTDSPSPYFGAKLNSDNGGEDQRRCDSGELETILEFEDGRNQALTPVERFRAEKRSDEPVRCLESSSETSQRFSASEKLTDRI